MAQNVQKIWYYLLGEPFVWFFYCFFQPTRFESEFEIRGMWKRVVPMLRLALPIFLLSYPLSLAIQLILSMIFPSAEVSKHSFNALFIATTRNTAIGVGWGTAVGIIAGIAGDTSLGIVLGIGFGVAGVVSNSQPGVPTGTVIALALGTMWGMARGASWGMTGGALIGIVGGFVWAEAWFLTRESQDIIGGLLVTTVFLVGYAIGSYRLPLYPISSIASFKAFLASRDHPLQVFSYLHRSSLYWDECVFLPLPRLKKMLLLAVEQDRRQALEEIAFISAQRPQQIGAAYDASLEIALRELEMCTSIHDIARASQQLTEIFPQDRPEWIAPLTPLNNASKDAARYCSLLNKKTRRDALHHMNINVQMVYSMSTFPDSRLKSRLREIANIWINTYQHELEQLNKISEESEQIDNPYNAGQVLRAHDSLFVGRQDLVQQLAEALARRSHRPTFLLNGERRMGKSSTLKQLPNLLGAQYLPIVYDLQGRGISSSTERFLDTLAEKIYKAVTGRGMKIQKLELLQSRGASDRNEAEIYHLFDQWLDDLENLLEREDCTLLLLFDEFEKLEEAATASYLNLHLLLDWFRSTIQNRPYVALLFSGIRTFAEMATNWAGYFVNVQTLKVSFLHPSEAHHLITQPVPTFPSQEIFDEGVVQEIIRVTGCHPFLIQATCYALIEHLNTGHRKRAELEDVNVALDQVLESWWDTYFRDLWERSDQQQQACLVALRDGDEHNLPQIVQWSSLDERTVKQTMQTLLKRDLVLRERGCYRITTPIFRQWVERNC